MKKWKDYKIGEKFLDGTKIKKKFFFDDKTDFIIFLNQYKEVIYKSRNEKLKNFLNNIEKLPLTEGELFSILYFFRPDLTRRLAHIYKLAFLGDLSTAKSELDNLNEQIQNRKKLLKKFIYMIVPLIASSFFYLIFCGINIFFKIDFLNKYLFLILFFGIGNFISISKNISKVEFDSSDNIRLYILFSFLKFLYSSFCGGLLIVLYKSNLINVTVHASNDKLFIYILAILGSFSENLIPNIFEKFTEKISTN